MSENEWFWQLRRMQSGRRGGAADDHGRPCAQGGIGVRVCGAWLRCWLRWASAVWRGSTERSALSRPGAPPA